MAHKHFPHCLDPSTNKQTGHHCSKGLWEGSTKIVASEMEVAQDENRSYCSSHLPIPEVKYYPDKGQTTGIL